MWFGSLGGTLRGRDWKKPGRGSRGKKNTEALTVDTISPKRPQDASVEVLKVAENTG